MSWFPGGYTFRVNSVRSKSENPDVCWCFFFTLEPCNHVAVVQISAEIEKPVNFYTKNAFQKKQLKNLSCPPCTSWKFFIKKIQYFRGAWKTSWWEIYIINLKPSWNPQNQQLPPNKLGTFLCVFRGGVFSLSKKWVVRWSVLSFPSVGSWR